MLIRSNFKDYYDFMAGYDDDRDTLLVRRSDSTEYESPVQLPDISAPHNAKYYIRAEVIAFCGNFYPFLNCFVNHPTNYRPVTIKLIYDKEKGIEVATKPRYSWGHNGVSKFFDFQGEAAWFDEFGPIFLLRAENNARKTVLVKNPRLEAYGFAHVMPPHIAYNTISRWLMTQARPEKPIPIMSNEVKIELAGFNTKTSFRRM